MPDIMLPQVPPAPAKAAATPAKSAEPVTESNAESGFSEVLHTRMRSDESAAGATADEAGANSATAEAQAAAAKSDGKPLPAEGGAAPAVAALTETVAALHAETATTGDAAVALPAGIAVLFPADATAAAQRARTAPQPAAAAVQPRPQTGPQATGARLELPEPAQASVAQAVREALAEAGEAALPRPLGEAFASQIRSLAAAQSRAGGAEVSLERLVQVPAPPPQTTTATPPTVLPALPQEGAAGVRGMLPVTTLETPFRQPGWDQALSERVLWMAGQRLQGAEIKLNPPQLGPIEVRVTLQHEQAHVSFTAQHASVREALEAALPRLREMFSASGFNLVDVNVSQHSFAEQQRQAQRGNVPRGLAMDDADAADIATPQELAQTSARSRGGIDLFA